MEMKPHRIFACRRRLAAVSASLALGAILMPEPLRAQAYGLVSDIDPLAPGYVYRAAGMLSTGNPLGTVDQLTGCSPDFNSLSPALKGEWLALEGGALFEREDPECLEVLTRLLQDYPTSPRATQAILTMGDWHWLHGDWHEAIEEYAKVDLHNLASGQRELYSYRKALAYLKCGLPENAEPLLAAIAGNPEYSLAAKYYTAYIRYLAKDYDQAYTMMEEVASEEAGGQGSGVRNQGSGARGRRDAAQRPNLAHSPSRYVSDGIEPLYYMAQMEYLRGDYADVIDHASTLMAKRPVAELLPELHRIMGLSLFKSGDHEGAQPHLEEYAASVETLNDDAAYALGAIRYEDSELNDAERLLRTLTDRNNTLAQGAYLYLGQIAEQRGDMNGAAMAFSKAANMAYDKNVAETAFHNHIVALTKGGNAPFASTITMLEDFLDKYPESRYAKEVRESLAAAYFYEHDYAKALASINGVRHPSKETLATKQKILYQLGTSELTSGQLQQAANHLREAADMTSTDATLADESRLWLAETLYASGDYKGAATAYAEAMRGNLTQSNKILARYGLGYSQFKTEDWRDAQRNFANVAENGSAPIALKGDALLRDADCLLYLGEYEKASAKYQRAAREGLGDADYAAFRHAVVTGVTEGTDSKMRKLNAFLSERPGSKWTPEVLLEAGNTMAALDRPDKASPYFERLTREYPKDTKSRSGALSLALSYMKQGETAKARQAYMEIIRTWPTSEEASLANDDMRRICAADGSLMEYAEFLSGIKGAPQIDPDEMDAITFEAAETAYAENQQNTKLLEQYIASFPDGRYLANALMDLAEAADQAGDTSKTLIYIDSLLSTRGDSQQVGAALFLKADLLENAGNLDMAYEAYQALEQQGGQEFATEATAGIMRTTSDPNQRTNYARRLLSMGGVTTEDAEDARFYEASGLLKGGQSSAGEEALRKLAASPNTLSGAKAAVELGEWQLANGDTKGALSTLEEFTDAGSVHSYWLARGFIALADAYHADGNDYLASEYLKSLRDNYPGDETDIAEAIETKIREYTK